MSTRHAGSPAETAALDAYIELMRAAEAVTARVDGVMATAGLTIGQFGVLEALLHHGPLCQRDLGAKLLRSDGNTTVVVANLARRGLVAPARRRDDRRFVTVSLTEPGRRLITEIFPRHVAGLVREMGRLARPEQAELGRLCRRLGLGDDGIGGKGAERWSTTPRGSGRSATTRRVASRSSTTTRATTSSRTSSRSPRRPNHSRRSPSARTSST